MAQRRTVKRLVAVSMDCILLLKPSSTRVLSVGTTTPHSGGVLSFAVQYFAKAY